MSSTGRHTVKTSITIPEADLEWLRQYAEREGRSVSNQISLLVRRLRAEVEGRQTPQG